MEESKLEKETAKETVSKNFIEQIINITESSTFALTIPILPRKRQNL